MIKQAQLLTEFLDANTIASLSTFLEKDENFEERMKEIHAELNILQNESNSLMEQINANLKELGLGE